MGWMMLRNRCPTPRPSPCPKPRPSHFPTHRPSRGPSQGPRQCRSSTWGQCLAQHPSRFPSRSRTLCPRRRPSVIRDGCRPQKRNRVYHGRHWWTMMILLRVPSQRQRNAVPSHPGYPLCIPSHLYHLLLPTGSHPTRSTQSRLRREQRMRRLPRHHLYHRPLQPAAQRGLPHCR